ncbi:myeloid cell nuclear differentiation antigen-like protein [Microtus ochrogaster]|uniref:Myeloid cell nuclear differentiation antigen-like protein n=1 Tax=Microtus ochrogaster TaxID=79684 RepID=A0ABM1UUV6_MICOH|nr:myeloid cell nuclear differentiation antigen-like protein [Microtus ochrogaster]
MSEYKKIVLLKGLERMEDYHFRTIKSLLKKELHLSENMQNDYDRIQIADKMEVTFQKDAGLDKLIEICQDINDLRDLVENLKKEKAKVEKRNKEKVKTAVKKRKQEEPSSSQSLSTDNEPNKNKPSSKKKCKTPTETEGGKKRKLTQKQTHLSKAPESNIQKDEDRLQTPHKPPSIPPSSSSNKKQKRINIKTQRIFKTEISQEEQQLPELSETRNSSAASELQNCWGLLTTASSSLQTPQTPPCFAFKKAQGSPNTPPCQNSLASPVSDSNTHLISHLPLTLSSGVQAPQVPLVTISESLLTPYMSPATASKSLLAPRASLATAISALHDPLGSPATTRSSSCKTLRRRTIPKEPSKEEGYHREPKEVMVLKVTEPFTYDLIDDKRMFHATVATENEFFRVKIFDPVLTNKFIPNKSIAISNYIGSNGFLEIHEASCVSDVDKNRTMNISKTLRQRANATPKIKDLFSQAQGTYVNGEFMVYQKTERSPFIYYGIEDDTGTMEVVVHGRLTNIKCEPGQKLRLVCFELSSSTDTWQLKSVRHSYMQVNDYFAHLEGIVQNTFQNIKIYPVRMRLPGLSIILEIMSEYKKIILLKGLELMEDYHFRVIKSILRRKLNLSKMMQDDYDRIQLADWMEDTFPKDAGLDTLIDVCQNIKELEDFAKTLKAEKAKVQKQKKGKNKTALGKRKQDEPSSSQSLSTSNESNKTPRRGNIPKEPAKEEGYHREPKEVMVLKVTEPFTYDLKHDKRMFHATVATENEFYRVKIFDPELKNKFIPKKIIAISNYIGSKGFLEIHETSCVSDVDKNRTMDISKTLRKRANATPKIRDLFSQAQGTYVNGEFVVYKKTERNPFIYYGIEDDTGKMEIVVHGRLTNIKCEPGQKLRLICFELSSSKDTWQLKSVRHSNMQVVNVRKKVPQA